MSGNNKHIKDVNQSPEDRVIKEAKDIKIAVRKLANHEKRVKLLELQIAKEIDKLKIKQFKDELKIEKKQHKVLLNGLQHQIRELAYAEVNLETIQEG